MSLIGQLQRIRAASDATRHSITTNEAIVGKGFRVSLVTVLTGLLVAAGSAADPAFRRQSIDDDVQIGYGVVIGNVDDDQRPDILIADKSEIAWYQNPGAKNKNWQRFVIARNLTPRDNVCVAARDITGDGLVEVAVGANWNPGETNDAQQSGAVFYLKRPADPTQAWTPVTLSPHDPTVHRMHWVQRGDDDFVLAVLPLHGQGNRNGQGDPVRLQAYKIDLDNPSNVDVSTIDESMHMTHNFHVMTNITGSENLLIAGSEGLKYIASERGMLFAPQPLSRGAGEVRSIDVDSKRHEAVAIEPMHGSDVVMYQQTEGSQFTRIVIDTGLNQGHALAAGDLLGLGREQVVAGWRAPNGSNKVGVRLYVPDEAGHVWTTHTIDDNQMACEDLRLADLDGDGRLDIIAAGRATNNLVVYWNESEVASE